MLLQEVTPLAQAYGVTRFAKGGIVTGPTNALIGEAGPEAVIPLTGKNSGMMGSVYNINVNAGIGTDGNVVGRQLLMQSESMNAHLVKCL